MQSFLYSSTRTPIICLIVLLLFRAGARAQEPQVVHPWLQECDLNGCFIDYYCDYSSNTCQQCSTNVSCGEFRNENTTADCENRCVRPLVGESCSSKVPCQEGKDFCDYQHGDSGTCQVCKNNNREDCVSNVSLTEAGMEDCLRSCELKCVPLYFSDATLLMETKNVTIPSKALFGSPLSNGTTGRLVDCSNLILENESVCANANGSICLVEDFTRNTYYVSVVEKCAANGGIAMIIFGDDTPETDNNDVWQGSLSFKETSIPSVSISFNNGTYLKNNKLNSLAWVSVYGVGTYCEQWQYCSEKIPCIGTSAKKYCDYKWGDGLGGCRSCPEDEQGNPYPLGCFFNIEDQGRVMGQQAVESCAATCASSLEFSNCKLCPKDVNGFDFGINPGEEECVFCPDDSVMNPQNEFRLFGEGIQCWQVQKFFDSVQVPSDAPNCHLARMMNYICGCDGPGYGGASTETKKAVLAWLPRAMAILSVLGSSFILFDSMISKEKREKLLHQLLIALSTFDIIASIAYALTTLPIPKNDMIPVFGARGNDATCTTQGFFIRIGTISCFINVSLAVYYLLAIKFGQNERKLKQKRLLFILCPLVVGLSFALAGIPFYSNMVLWCDNTASWWPDIPVALAILSATVIMGIVCWDVYRKEKASARWRGDGTGRARNKLSIQVFWQSFWYLMAFYLTWPAYLTLQYSWASDTYFSNYGLILSAGTMVPLQGFWNFFVYIRPRQMKQATRTIRRASTRIFARLTSQTASSREASTRSFLTRFGQSSLPTPSARTASDEGTSRNVPSSDSHPETFDLTAVNDD